MYLQITITLTNAYREIITCHYQDFRLYFPVNMGGQVASLSEPKPVEVLIGSTIDHRQLGHAQKLPGNKPGNPAYLGYLMVGAVVCGVLVNLFAAMLQAKQLKNRKVKATFSNLKVQLVFLASDKEVKEEVYTWSDVKKVADTSQYLLLAFKKRPRFLLCIAKQKLALDEIKWLQELTG